MRKWIPLLIVAAAVIASAVVYPSLPDRLPTHWNLRGEVDGWSGRTWGAWMIPLMILFLWGLMRWLPSIDPRGSNYVKFGGAFEGIMLSVMLFMLGVHAIILRSALGYPVDVDRLMPVGVGILLVVIGNLLPRSRPNWFVGIRTPWTLSSDRVWEKTHRVGGRLFVIGGLLIAAAGLLMGDSKTWVVGVVIAVCALGAVVYSYLEWRKEKSAPAV
ncbi:MAG: SdpI family protein [Gemmatimonadaceae bacterium]